MIGYNVFYDELVDLNDGIWDAKIASFDKLDDAKAFMAHLESLNYTKYIHITGRYNGNETIVPPSPYQKWATKDGKWKRVKPIYPYMKMPKGHDRFA